MPEWLTALLASPLVIGAATIAGREVTRALAARSAAGTARINAETERMLAEARVRESQARITESDAMVLRTTLAKVLEERELDAAEQARDREEARATRRELGSLKIKFRDLEGALLEAETARAIEMQAREKAEDARAKVEHENHAMRREWGEIWRLQRLPKATPRAFAAVDHTVPFHTGKAT